VERDRGLKARMPPGAEGRRQHLADLRHDRGVGAALGLPDDEQAVEQLEALTDEDAEIDETIVLDAPPAPGLHIRLDHGHHSRQGNGTLQDRQRLRSDTPGARLSISWTPRRRTR